MASADEKRPLAEEGRPASGAYIFQPERVLLRRQVERYAPYTSGLLLDIGSGHFSRYRKLLPCRRYVRMDVSLQPEIDIVASAEVIPAREGSFDSVLCTQVFEHLRRPDLAAGEIYRILKPGGHCLITVPQVNELHEEPHDYFPYTSFGPVDLFERQGFRTIACDQRGGFFTVVAQLATRYCIDRGRLYRRPIAGRMFNRVSRVFGSAMIWLESVDRGTANRKHALGYCAVFEK